MANKKTIGTVLLVVGIVLLIGSFTVDALGLGTTARFGYKQILAAVTGVILVVGGFVYSRR